MKKKIYDLSNGGPYTLQSYKFSDIIHALALLSGKKTTTTEIATNLQFKMPPVIVRHGKLAAAIKESGLDKKAEISRSQKDVFENKLLIEIDLTYSREHILDKIEEVVRFYEKFTGKRPKQKKSTENYIDPWEIFYMHTDDKMTFRQIARLVSQRKDLSKYRASLDVWQKRIEGAYKRAFEVLKVTSLMYGKYYIHMVEDEIFLLQRIDDVRV